MERSATSRKKHELRKIIWAALVFGVDDETIEHAVLTQLQARGRMDVGGVTESVTGGLIGARIANVAGRERDVPRQRSAPARPT